MRETITPAIISECASLANSMAIENFARLGHYDSRVILRTVRVAASIFSSPNTRFSQVFKTEAERKAGYRLIEKETLAPSDLISSAVEASSNRIRDLGMKMVLIPQDTSTFTANYSTQIEGLGCVGCEKSSGFFFHSALGLTQAGIPIGLLGMKIFTRPKHPKKSRNAWKTLPIEEKESYRWQEMAREVVDVLPRDVEPVFISDRESDIHEYFQELFDLNARFVIRHSHNRRTIDKNGELETIRERLASAPVSGHGQFSIPKSGSRKPRTVCVSLQWERIEFHLRKGGLAIHRNRRPIALTAVRIYENEPPAGEKGIDWILYTDLPIQNAVDALEVLRIYTCRWRIEDFHLTLKSGMRIEQNRLEKAENIQRLLAIAAPMAVKIMEILYRSRNEPSEAASTVFTQEEIIAIKAIAKMQNRNISSTITIQQATNCVAFLGGWMGRKGDGPPGVRTFWEGWRQVQFLVQAMATMIPETNTKVPHSG